MQHSLNVQMSCQALCIHYLVHSHFCSLRAQHLTLCSCCNFQILSVDIEMLSPCNEVTRTAGEAVLLQLKDLAAVCPRHQPLACRKVLQELRLSKPGDALRTAQQFVEVIGQECAPAQWALHLTARTHWLQGQLPLVSLCCLLESGEGFEW